MIKTFAAAVMFSGASAALVPAWPNCGRVSGWVNTMNSCGCVDAWSKPVPGTSVCECLDKTLTWMPNGSSCSLGNTKKSAYVNAMKTRFEPFNNAASRAANDRALANATTKQRSAAWADWCPYSSYWKSDCWVWSGACWPITSSWWGLCNNRWGLAQRLNASRQNFITERAEIEEKLEATPWSNQLDLIVGSLGTRAGAGFNPSSIWSSATQSNELGRERNAATERRDPQMPYEFNN